MLKKHFLVPAAHLESVRSASYQTYLEAHQLWIRSGESVEPKVLLPIAEKLGPSLLPSLSSFHTALSPTEFFSEAVSSQLSQVLRLPSLNSDEIALQKDQLNALLEEGRKSIGDFKIMIMEQYDLPTHNLPVKTY